MQERRSLGGVRPSWKSTPRSTGSRCKQGHRTARADGRRNSHIPGDGSNIHNNPAPPFRHVWDDKLREPHWSEEVYFEHVPGSSLVNIQDRAYLRMSLSSLLCS